MFGLTEHEQRILSELEEAGHEDVPTMMITTMPLAGALEELVVFSTALDSLIRRGFVRMCNSRSPTGQLVALAEPESLQAIAELKERLTFDVALGNWTHMANPGPPYQEPYPYIVQTAEGAKIGLSILQHRGYQWWRAP